MVFVFELDRVFESVELDSLCITKFLLPARKYNGHFYLNPPPPRHSHYLSLTLSSFLPPLPSLVSSSYFLGSSASFLLPHSLFHPPTSSYFLIPSYFPLLPHPLFLLLPHSLLFSPLPASSLISTPSSLPLHPLTPPRYTVTPRQPRPRLADLPGFLDLV